MKLRAFLSLILSLSLGAGALLGLSTAAQAQTDFPNKPVSLVTPFPAGSGPDAVLRILAEKLSKIWNQQVLVVNRPGGNGFVAVDATQRAAPDGYTLLQLDSEHLSALPYLYKTRNFAPFALYDPVAPIFKTAFMVAVPTTSNWKDLKDLVAAARANPGKVNYGSWSVGSPGHLGGERMELLTNTQMNHVPFKEMSQLFTNVGNGEIDWSMASIPSSSGVYKAGKLRYLAVAAPQRLPQMPDVPTAIEAGGPAGFEVNSFVVILAPKGVAPALRNKIHADVLKALADPDLLARFNNFAFEALNWSPEEIVKAIAAKAKINEELIRRKNISLE
jgi:tripartite-type tricarboxylate transporter receptor subunit TctC